MKKRICPVCDQVMHSSNYCRTCHRFVRNPYIRDINYYLNETHHRDEADCSYHNFPGQSRPIGQAGQSQPIGQVGQTQIPAQPQAGWQRQTSSRGSAAPAYQTSQMVQPARTTAYATQTVKKKESSKWILFLVAFFVMIFFGASQFFRFVADQINDMGYGSGYDVDLGTYEQDWNPAEWEEDAGEWEELTDDEVFRAGERCTAYDHFSVTESDFAPELVEIIASHGYQVRYSEADSYNYRYNYDNDDAYTSYNTWSTSDIIRGGKEQRSAEELYQYLFFEYDSATYEIHSMEVVLDDMEDMIAITGELLELMVEKEMISSQEDYEQFFTGLSEVSFVEAEEYITADGRVMIECYQYDEDDTYSIYFYPYDESGE